MLFETSLSKKVASGVSWLAVAQVAQRATTLVITAVLARKLLPEDFGLIALVLLTVNFISYFQDASLSAALVQRQQIDDDHLSTAFCINVVGGIVLGLLGLALSPLVASVFRAPRLIPLLAVTMSTMPINGCGWASDAVLQRRLLFSRIAFIQWLGTFISGIVAVLLAVSGAGVWSLVAQNIICAIVLACGRLIGAGWVPKLRFNLQRAKDLFSFSLGAMGYSLVNHWMRNVDNAIVGALLGTTALGYYSLAYNLILLPGMTIGGLVGRVMFPTLSLLQNDIVRFRYAYLRMARGVTVATVPLIIGLGATAPLFVVTIYGSRWVPSIHIVQILIVVGLFEAIGFWNTAVWALGKTKVASVLAALSLGAMTISFAIGVRWGLTGVAWSYVIVGSVIFVIPHIMTNKLLGIRIETFFKALAPSLCAAAVMGISVWLALSAGVRPFASDWANLAVYVMVGALIYVVALLTIAVVSRPKRGVLSWLLGSQLAEAGAERA